MSARSTPNLARRHGVFYFRGYIPLDLQPAARRREVRVSLRTRDSGRAKIAARAAAFAYDSLCGRLRTMIHAQAPDQDIREAVQAFGKALFASAEPPPSFAGPSIDRDFAHAKFYTGEEISALEQAVHDNDFASRHPDIEDPRKLTLKFAAQVAAGLASDGPLSEARMALLRLGIARAQLEERRHHYRRLDEPFSPLVVTDPLFSPTATAAPSATGLTFEEAIGCYVKAKSGVVWTPRTEEENRRVLRFAADHFGSHTRVQTITLDQVRAFRDSVVAWRKKPPASATLTDIANAPLGQRIRPKSAAKYFGYVSALFSYLFNEGFLGKSPVGKMSVQVPHNANATSRIPFSSSDLASLYSSPLFTGCAGPTRRTVPGPHVYRDGQYWALLIAPLSGMRITEIVQLACDDINFDDAVPTFRIKADASQGQTVKSDSGWRRVPIHRRLLELGLREYVTRRQAETSTGRLFPDIPISKTGGAGGEFSKVFGRHLHRLKLKKQGLVFHSFRHGFVDALRELDAPEYVIKKVVGHASGSVTDGYGAGASLKGCQAWIDKITLLDALPPSK